MQLKEAIIPDRQLQEIHWIIILHQPQFNKDIDDY
jgi:hypothetical protein